MHILPGLTHTVVHILHTYGLIGLFLLLIVEEAGVPLPAPGDTLIALAGAQPGRTLGYTAQVLFLCTLAVFIGSSALYWVMRVGGRTFVDRYGRYIRLNQQRMDRIEAWIVKRGTVAIVLGRLIPGLRIPTTAICGLTRVPYRVYAPSAALAGFVWASIYYLLGSLLEKHLAVITSSIIGVLDSIADSTLLSALTAALLIALAIGVWHAFRRWRGRRPTSTGPTTVSTDTTTGS